LKQIAEFHEYLFAILAQVVGDNQFPLAFHIDNIEVALIAIVANK
jgi:hypothetical protein